MRRANEWWSLAGFKLDTLPCEQKKRSAAIEVGGFLMSRGRPDLNQESKRCLVYSSSQQDWSCRKLYFKIYLHKLYNYNLFFCWSVLLLLLLFFKVNEGSLYLKDYFLHCFRWLIHLFQKEEKIMPIILPRG